MRQRVKWRGLTLKPFGLFLGETGLGPGRKGGGLARAGVAELFSRKVSVTGRWYAFGMSKEYVKLFVGVLTAPSKRNIDGRIFDDPVQSILDVIGNFKEKGVAVVGNYDNVSFTFAKGDGRYRATPGSSATPTKGEVGEMHREAEVCITFVAPKDSLPELLPALKDNHPYETPAIDIVDLVRHEFDCLG